MSAPVEKGLRFALITPEDHGGCIWVSTLLSLIYSFLALVVRAIIKRGRYGVDDAALLVAYIFALAHWSTIFSALNHGLGKSKELMDNAQESKASELIYASRILLFIVVALSKCSILLLVRVLFTEAVRRKIWWTCNVCLGLIAAWGVVAALAVSVGCSSDQTLAGSGCSGEARRWELVIAFDVITEALIVFLVGLFVLPLQMKFKRRYLVLLAFAFRLPIVAFSITSLRAYLDHLHRGASNIGLSYSISFQEGWMCYALISTTIPCLKGFFRAFTTTGLTGGINTYGLGGGSGRSTGGSFFPLNSLRSATQNIKLRPDLVSHDTQIYPGHSLRHDRSQAASRDVAPEESTSIASRGSKKMIIKKVIEWGITTS